MDDRDSRIEALEREVRMLRDLDRDSRRAVEWMRDAANKLTVERNEALEHLAVERSKVEQLTNRILIKKTLDDGYASIDFVCSMQRNNLLQEAATLRAQNEKLRARVIELESQVVLASMRSGDT